VVPVTVYLTSSLLFASFHSDGLQHNYIQKMVDIGVVADGLQVACIDTSCDSGTSTLETYYSNFIARQLYA